jgi:hypothetical protein
VLAVGVLALAVLFGAACAGPSRLRGGPPEPKTPQGRAYLQQLSAEQAKLAAAEHRIPRRARTPAALSRSIALLAAAIGGLADGLDAIKPPREVAGLHARLVRIVRDYQRRLSSAARDARTRVGEVRAAGALAAVTNAASEEFTATISQIDRRLAM